jgi:GNAT superfamily N-acetyltransferase
MRIRRVRSDEWRELRALRFRALTEDPDAFGSTLAEEMAEPEDVWRGWWLDRPDGVGLVGEEDCRLVAMAFGGPAPGHEGAAGIFGMWVDPVARRRGTGAALIERLIRWARTTGYRQVGLGVTTTNADAIAFYTKLGFSDSGGRMPLREGTDLTIQIMLMDVGPAG